MAEDSRTEAETADNGQFYVDMIQATIYGFAELLGGKTALTHARRAPVNITPDGQVTGYYGKGDEAFDVLVRQYESVFGREVADRKVRNMLADTVADEERHLLPERLQPEGLQEKIGLVEQIGRLLPFVHG
jgi:hypothetical protein